VFESFEPEVKILLGEKLKQKLSEELPKLQLKLIDDFRKQETSHDPATPLEDSPDLATAGDPGDAALHVYNEISNAEFPMGLLENMDWTAFDVPEFDFTITYPPPGGSSEGSSVTHDLESPESSFLGLFSEKRADSGYVSWTGAHGR
jgi:hypothetical protein